MITSGFPASQVYAFLDYETFSEAGLKEYGGYEYSLHPSTDIICAAWRIGTLDELVNDRAPPTVVWSDMDGATDSSPVTGLYAALTNPDVLMVAHNAFFEYCITRNVFVEKYFYSKRRELAAAFAPERWVCTQALACAMALPAKLELVGEALNLPIKKDMAGNKLIQKWCKPRKPSKHNPATRHTDAGELRRLMDYCITDVDVELEAFKRVAPLTPLERRIWVLDQRINFRGMAIDRELVETAQKLIAVEIVNVDQRTDDLTFGVVPTTNRVAATLDWLEREAGFPLPDLKAKTVEDALDTIRRLEAAPDSANVPLFAGASLKPWSPETLALAREMLELRQARAGNSTAKYRAFDLRSWSDGRARGEFKYHRASTGRWAGAGVQMHNLPRGNVKDTKRYLKKYGEPRALYQAVEVVKTGDLELVRLLYGDVMKTLSSCLRAVVVASEGHTLDVADYSAIEARVLFWVAEHEDGLRAFRENRPIYEEMAADIFGVPVASIPKEGIERFLGKQAVLGCGYSMGGPKFQLTCKGYGQDVSDELALRSVKAYRAKHAPVVRLWKALETAACRAVAAKGRREFATNKTVWKVEGDFLFCTLPSGRRLAYHRPEIQYEKTPWGEPRPVLFHYGEDGKTHKWVKAKTYGGKLTENVIQAVSRDLLAEALLRIEETGRWRVVMHVHDEIVGERRLGGPGNIGEFIGLMTSLPKWAAGCPVAAEGWSNERYRK